MPCRGIVFKNSCPRPRLVTGKAGMPPNCGWQTPAPSQPGANDKRRALDPVRLATDQATRRSAQQFVRKRPEAKPPGRSKPARSTSKQVMAPGPGTRRCAQICAHTVTEVQGMDGGKERNRRCNLQNLSNPKPGRYGFSRVLFIIALYFSTRFPNRPYPP